MRPSLDEVKKGGSKFYKYSYYPRDWEKRIVRNKEGNVIAENKSHALYLSKRSLDLMKSRRGGWRWKVPPRKWDRKRGVWIYRYRHKKIVEDKDLNKEHKDGNFIIKESTGEGVNRISWIDTLVGKGSGHVIGEMGVKRVSAFKHGAPKGIANRRGRKAGSYPLQIRRCISKVLQAPMECENDPTNIFSIDSVINCVDDDYSRGTLVKKTVIMPDFSLALREFLLRREVNGERVEMEGVLANHCKGDLDVSPEKVMSLLPERGPGSGEAQSLVSRILDMRIEDLDEGHIEDLQEVVNRIWRGLLSRLIELCLEKEDEGGGVSIERREVHDGRVVAIGSGECLECGLGSSMALDEKKGEVWCQQCGWVQSGPR